MPSFHEPYRRTGIPLPVRCNRFFQRKCFPSPDECSYLREDAGRFMLSLQSGLIPLCPRLDENIVRGTRLPETHHLNFSREFQQQKPLSSLPTLLLSSSLLLVAVRFYPPDRAHARPATRRDCFSTGFCSRSDHPVMSLRTRTHTRERHEHTRGASRMHSYFCVCWCVGSVLQYSIFVCTRVNSALTTSVVGCAKNLLTTVVGMFGMGDDYKFGVLNCVGMAVSMAGSFLYSWAKVTKR